MLSGALQGVVCQQLVKTADGKGRVVAVEIMIATPAIRNLIREGKTHQIYSALQAGAKHGMQTMDSHLAQLVKQGKITYDAALEKCHHVEDFNRFAAGARGRTDGYRYTFEYKVRDSAGKLKTGKIDAESSARSRPSSRHGLRPLEHHQANTGMKQGDLDPGYGQEEGQAQGLAVMSRQFATMINSGLSLLRALTILTEQTENKELAAYLGEVRNDIETGTSLSVGMGKHPDVFPPLMVNMCRAGEVGGFLDTVLLQIAAQLRGRGQARGKVKAAMTYPRSSFCASRCFAVVGMLLFIVPTFAELFSTLGGTLPAPTACWCSSATR
jgi:hypothetical protein